MTQTQALSGERFSLLVTDLIRKLNLLNRDQKVCYGLTLPQCGAVETLDRKGMLPMKELSQQMGVTVSTMTRGIDILVRDDIVVRKPAPGDRRKVCIELTEKGGELAQKLRKCSLDYAGVILDKIPEPERPKVFEALEVLNGVIDRVSSRCCE